MGKKSYKLHRRVSWDGSYISYPLNHHLAVVGQLFESSEDSQNFRRQQTLPLLLKTEPFDTIGYSLFFGSMFRLTCLDDIEMACFEAPIISNEGAEIPTYNKHRGRQGKLECCVSFFKSEAQNEIQYDTTFATELYRIAVLKHERIPIEWSLNTDTYYLFLFRRLRTNNAQQVPFYLYIEYYTDFCNEERLLKYLIEE